MGSSVVETRVLHTDGRIVSRLGVKEHPRRREHSKVCRVFKILLPYTDNLNRIEEIQGQEEVKCVEHSLCPCTIDGFIVSTPAFGREHGSVTRLR